MQHMGLTWSRMINICGDRAMNIPTGQKKILKKISIMAYGAPHCAYIQYSFIELI